MTTEVLSERYDAYVHSHTGTTTAKTFLLLQSKAVLPLNSAGANEANVFAYRAAKVRVPKATGEAWTPGAKIYWDDTAKKFTTTATSNTVSGRIVEAAASGDTEGIIDLDPAQA